MIASARWRFLCQCRQIGAAKQRDIGKGGRGNGRDDIRACGCVGQQELAFDKLIRCGFAPAYDDARSTSSDRCLALLSGFLHAILDAGRCRENSAFLSFKLVEEYVIRRGCKLAAAIDAITDPGSGLAVDKDTGRALGNPPGRHLAAMRGQGVAAPQGVAAIHENIIAAFDGRCRRL